MVIADVVSASTERSMLKEDVILFNDDPEREVLEQSSRNTSEGSEWERFDPEGLIEYDSAGLK